jgi:hypothetical protein
MGQRDILNGQPLEEGKEVTLNIPFTYTIGEEGFHTGKILRTAQDCEDELRAEIESGMMASNTMVQLESIE